MRLVIYPRITPAVDGVQVPTVIATHVGPDAGFPAVPDVITWFVVN